MQRDAKTHRAKKISSELNRRLSVERLERRAVLCSVTCELADGVLSVFGSESDDSIELRLVDGSQTLEVRGEGELAGSFPAGSVKRVIVDGKEGNDLISIDQTLPQSVDVGSKATESITYLNSQPEAESSAALLAFPALPFTGVSSLGGHDHASHSSHASSSEPTATPLASPHESHGSSFMPLLVQSDSAGEHGGHSVSSKGTASTATIIEESGSLSRSRGNVSVTSKHAQHNTSSDKSSTDLAPKFCLTTPYTKVLIANVDRKPECWCREEKQKQPEIVPNSENVAVHSLGASLFSAITRPAAEATKDAASCDRAFLFGSNMLFDVCSDDIVDATQLPILPPPSAATSTAWSSSTDAAMEEAGWLGEGTWSEKMERAGWIMLAVGLVFAPQLLAREKKSDEDEYSPKNSAWNAGGMELLTA